MIELKTLSDAPPRQGLGVNIYRAFGKRLFDVVVALTALIVLSPVLLVIAGSIAVLLGRPVLFRQQRAGTKGEPFTLLKFRTMRDDCDGSGEPLPDSERLPPFGQFLRSSSLDELPNLWNVLRGEMSIVGPRPLLVEYLGQYTTEQMRRHDIRSGITGWAQVNGRNCQGWEERFQLDVWYVDNCSLGLDIRILALTLKTVARRDGVRAVGHATMPAFKGSAR
jgi:lipopolysaccharide/colanic/teichoic acid biosynthesis glycosyltransferase